MAAAEPIIGSEELPDEPEEVGGRRSPLRRCIATGTVMPREDMIRFVVDPEGRLVPDMSETLPGRGHWISARKEALEQAVQRKMFARAARRPVIVAPDVLDAVQRLLRQRCLDTLGLARRAGQAVCGFDKVHSALKGGHVAILLAASDGAEDGRSKLRGLGRNLPVVECFDSEMLGAAFGRDRSIHAAVLSGGVADRFLREVKRYSGILPGSELKQGALSIRMDAQTTDESDTR